MVSTNAGRYLPYWNEFPGLRVHERAAQGFGRRTRVAVGARPHEP